MLPDGLTGADTSVYVVSENDVLEVGEDPVLLVSIECVEVGFANRICTGAGEAVDWGPLEVTAEPATGVDGGIEFVGVDTGVVALGTDSGTEFRVFISDRNSRSTC